jgi:O-antigen/teichoic acid export membrane protein
VVLAGVINFAYSLSLTRALSQHDYSIFAAGQSLLLVSGALAVAAIPWVLAQELVVAEGDPLRRRAAIQFAFEVNFLGGLVAAVVVGLFSTTFTSWPTTGVLALGTLLLVLGSTGAGYLQGNGRMNALAVVGLAEFGTKAIFGVIAVFIVGLGINAALGAAAVGAAVLTGLGLFYMRTELGWIGRRPPSAHMWRSVAKIGGLQVIVALYSAADTVLAAALASTQAHAASYQVASALGRIPFFFSVALSTSAFPRLVNNPGNRHARVVALRAYLGLSIFFTVSLLTMPDEILQSLLPPGYSGLRGLLVYTAILGVAIGMLNLLTTFVQAQVSVRDCVVLLVDGLVIHCAAMYLGAHFDGTQGLAYGACAASLATVVMVALLPTERGAGRLALTSTRPILLLTFGGLLLPLCLFRNVTLWLIWAAVAGVAVTLGSFSELKASVLSTSLVTSLRSTSRRGGR